MNLSVNTNSFLNTEDFFLYFELTIKIILTDIKTSLVYCINIVDK